MAGLVIVLRGVAVWRVVAAADVAAGPAQAQMQPGRTDLQTFLAGFAPKQSSTTTANIDRVGYRPVPNFAPAWGPRAHRPEPDRSLDCDKCQQRFEQELGKIAKARPNRPGQEMHTYRLSPNPATLSDPRWRLSRITDVVWVRAETSGQARGKVANTTMAVSAPLGRSPWYDDAFANCVMDTARDEVPNDAVVTSDGHPL
jgi:hypothetical protein